MKSLIRKIGSEGQLRSTALLCSIGFVLLVFCFVGSLRPSVGKAQPAGDLRAHEWGTFTSIAGNDGQAVEWLPLSGSTDLPGFVEHLRGTLFKVGLRGTVRMETPVLYFYSSSERSVSVKVSFSKGVITEWYPHASGVKPAGDLSNVALREGQADGSIAWDSVKLEPARAADFPREAANNAYYAARETSATSLRVKTSAGDQQEKFLFYRGVSAFPVPVSVKLTAEGKLLVTNLSREEIPKIILFERRGDRLGYRVAGSLQDAAVLDPPELTGTIESLGRDLVEILVAQGLYRDEAQAMVKTWQHSWFEEGSRVLYVVPARFVDSILPLSINPAPAQTVRVFVGRLELVTPATKNAVENALASHDRVTLEKYGRFLEPIFNTIVEGSSPAKAKQLRADRDSLYAGLPQAR
jgi:hypothetical protein